MKWSMTMTGTLFSRMELAIRLSRGESSPEGGGLLFQPEMVIRDSTRFRGAPRPGYNRKESETP